MIVKVRDVIIGGDYIPVQSMIKNSPYDVDQTISKIDKLSQIGCDIIRITVPDQRAVKSLEEVLKYAKIPVVADIHFDYRLAVKAIEAGVDKIRINPGNIGDAVKVKTVIDCLKQHHIPVRIGINKGSLDPRLKKKYGDPVRVMLESAKEELEYFKEAGYDNYLLSFKTSNVLETIHVNREARKLFDCPLHLGVTEAGDLSDGSIKNTAAMSILLSGGIGDTIRVSLTAPETEEVKVGIKILEALGKRVPAVEIISCPTCGRTTGEVKIDKMVAGLKEAVRGKKYNRKLKIAVMGCIVNGPGEAEDCDFGIACGKGQSILFKDGKKLKMIKNEVVLDELLILLEAYLQ